MHRADLVIGFILVAFGTLVVSEAAKMPRYASIGANPVTVPGLVPGILGGIIALLGLIMAFRAVVALRAGAHANGSPDHTAVFGVEAKVEEAPSSYVPEPPQASRNRFVAMLTMSLAFAAVALGRIPFWLAAFLFVFVTITLLELPRFSSAREAAVRLAFALVIAGGVAWAVPYVFETIFLVRLP
jgi:Ca2+/Na+ antiporter